MSETRVRDLPAPEGQRVELFDVPWEVYEALGEAFRDRPVFLTYDRGYLEIMTTSLVHETPKGLLGVLVRALAEELDIDLRGGGNTTFKQRALARGLEPDECFWIQHLSQMQHRTDYDSATDPPPDLVLEIEVSHPVGRRMGIYAAMGFPEIWRWDGEAIHVHLLQPEGTYQESPRGRAFPFLTVAEVVRFLRMSPGQSDTKILRAFRQWVRAQAAAGWPV